MRTAITVLRTPNQHAVSALALSDDGSKLVTGDAKGGVHLWNLADKERIEHGKHHWAVVDVAISADNSAVASLSGSQRGTKSQSELACWCLESGEVVLRRNRPNMRYRCLKSLSDGHMFAVKHGHIAIYDGITGENGGLINEQTTGDEFTISPDGASLVFGTQPGPLHVWTLGTKVNSETPDRKLIGHHYAQVDLLAFSEDGSLLATLDQQGELRIWDFLTGKTLAERMVDFDRAMCCGWISSRGEWLLVDDTSQTWRLTPAGELYEVGDQLQEGGLTAAAICCESELVALGNSSGKVVVYSVCADGTFGARDNQGSDE